MDQKALKLPFIIAESKNFSEFETYTPDGEDLGFDAGDKGKQADEMVENLGGDQLILSILSQLDDRQKVIFMYQLLLDAGYKMTQEECAETLSISKMWYSVVLKKIRVKVAKIINDSHK